MADEFVYHIGSVSVISNKRTRDYVILREMNIQQGLTISGIKLSNYMEEDCQNIKNIGIFKDVKINYIIDEETHSKTNQIRVIVQAEDRWTLFPIPIYSYNNRSGHSGGFLLADFNLFGTGTGFLMYGYLSSEGGYTGVAWSEPRLFGSRIDFDIMTGYEKKIEHYYRDGSEIYYNEKTGFYFNFSLGRKFGEALNSWEPYIDLEYEYVSHDTTINPLGLLEQPDNILQIKVGVEQGDVNRDMGMMWGMENEFWVGYEVGSRTISGELTHNHYIKLNPAHVFAYRVNVFYTGNNGTFFSSYSSIRGIKTGELSGNYGAFSNIELRNLIGKAHILMDLEFYYPIYIDVGYAQFEWEEWNIDRAIVSVGTGLRVYATDIGGAGAGLRVDVGWNISKTGEDLSWWDKLFLGLGFMEMF